MVCKVKAKPKTDPQLALNYEHEMGRREAHRVYLKQTLRHPPNPHKDVQSGMWKHWNRGWLAGCDEVLNELRAKGECIDA